MQEKTGTVSSVKMQKTIVVRVDRFLQHPKYHKRYRVSKKFYAHDEARVAKEGDTVTIQECRPLSRLKRWKLVEVNGQPVKNTIPTV
jgi:small subunit ribosomal protein S17